MMDKEKLAVEILEQCQNGASVSDIMALLEAPADVEPVLYAIKNHKVALKMHNGQTLCAGKPSELHCVPLYTHPPADKDAERYRWLRGNFMQPNGDLRVVKYQYLTQGTRVYLDISLDDEIDKAMGEVNHEPR